MNNSNIVTQRFTKCVHRLRANKTIKSSRQFATEVDCLPQTLSEILNGRRDATIEVIRRSVERHRFHPTYLFTGEGEMFLPPPVELADTPSVIEPENEPSDSISTTASDHALMLSEIKILQKKMSDLQQIISNLVEKA